MKYANIDSAFWWEMQEIKCSDTNEDVFGYKNYLKTAHWKNLRLNIYRKYNRKCCKCGKSLQLRDANAHHLTYDNIGHENEDDLILVCHECHKKIHNIVTKKRNKKSWKDKTFKKVK